MIRMLVFFCSFCLLVKCNLSTNRVRKASHQRLKYFHEPELNQGEDVGVQHYECKKLALWKCGHSMMKASNFLNHHLSKDEAIFLKCSTRNAFFNCLKKTEARYCSKIGMLKYRLAKEPSPIFKQKLVKTLWKSNNCLLTPSLFRFNKFRLLGPKKAI